MSRQGLSDVQAHRLDRGARQRHGASGGVRGRRLRPGTVHRLRVGHGHRAHRPAQVGRRRHPALLRERPALPGAVPAVKIVHQWLAELVDVPADAEAVAAAIALRGFEVASVERGVIDFEITANRPDCLNHVGIAREASVIWKSAVRPLTLAPAVATGETIDVDLQDGELCPRYCAQVFEVRIGPSPAWLAERLEAAGVRPINNIVDVTNYVMLEMGQPMHAFDVTRLDGGRLVIRRAAAGEQRTTLDGVERRLEADMLVIADAGRATAVAGVMGGGSSEIHAGTTKMVLESGYFQPASVRRTSKKLGLKTEASTR